MAEVAAAEAWRPRPRAGQRDAAAQRPQQEAAFDQHLAPRGLAVVVETETREFLAPRRVVTDVEQRAAVSVATEQVERDEAGAGEVALVAEDAVELQRVADALVDLQHHLVRHQQHRHRARRAVRRHCERDRLSGETGAVGQQTRRLDHLVAALAAETVVLAAAGTRLGLAGDGGDGAQVRHGVAESLEGVAAVAGQQPLLGGRQRRLGSAVDDAGVDAHRAAGVGEQRDAVGDRGRQRLLVGAKVFAARRGHRAGVEAMDAAFAPSSGRVPLRKRRPRAGRPRCGRPLPRGRCRRLRRRSTSRRCRRRAPGPRRCRRAPSAARRSPTRRAGTRSRRPARRPGRAARSVSRSMRHAPLA